MTITFLLNLPFILTVAALRTHLYQLPSDSLIKYIIKNPQDSTHLDPYSNTSLLTPILIPRQPSTSGSEIVRNYISAHFESLNYTVKLQQFTDQTPVGEKTFTNIIATKDINAPRKIILAAHYDSKVLEGMVEGVNKVFEGATDSAGPCAVLIDIAKTIDRYLSSNEAEGGNGGMSVEFIFFDGEEAFIEWRGNDNTYGSRLGSIHAPANELDQVDLFILLDLLGSSNPFPVIYNYYSETTTLFQYLSNIEDTLLRLGMLSKTRSKQEKKYFADGNTMGSISDDQIPFVQRNVPVLHLIPSPFPRVWHSLNDDASAIDSGILYDYSKILQLFVLEYLDIGIPLFHDE